MAVDPLQEITSAVVALLLERLHDPSLAPDQRIALTAYKASLLNLAGTPKQGNDDDKKL